MPIVTWELCCLFIHSQVFSLQMRPKVGCCAGRLRGKCFFCIIYKQNYIDRGPLRTRSEFAPTSAKTYLKIKNKTLRITSLYTHCTTNIKRSNNYYYKRTTQMCELAWFIKQYCTIAPVYGASVCVCALATAVQLHVKWSCKHKSQLQTAQRLMFC